MTGSSTSPVSDPIQSYARISSGTCCLLMTQQLPPTPRRNSCHWWTASHRPVRTSDWPSVWRRRMSWDRTHKHRRSLAFTTTNSMLSASSPTSAPPSLITSHWRQRSTRWLGRQLQLSLLSRLNCGQAPSCLWRQRWQYTMPVLPAHCCMAARHGLHVPGRWEGLNIPPEKHPPYPGHMLAGQSNQRWCPVSCWSSQYVHST